MSIPAGANPRQAAATARTLPGVLQASPDPIVRINDQIPPRDPIYKDDDDPSTIPCDPLFEICDPWELVDQWGLFQVEAEGGWVVQRGSQEVVIAILDSGMDLDHDDLWANIWTNPGEIPDNGIDDDGNGLIDDVHGADFSGNNVGDPSDNPGSQDGNPDIAPGGSWVEDPTAYPFGIRFDGDPAVGDAVDNNLDFAIDLGVFHGTFVGGIAGADTDNINPDTLEYEGMAGVCWHCKLMPVRFINAEGTGYGSDAAAAVYYAVDMGAQVINASWGIDLNSADPSEIQVIAQAVDYAVSKGVIFVAAAGNSGTSGVHFPASMANTIAVGSSNWLDQRSDFSSFAASGETLDVIAPGELIWSTSVFSAYDALLYDFLGLPGWEPGTETYGGADGTSFSTPLVSGYVGLILSHNPGATLGQVRQVIRSNAVDILDPNGVGDFLEGYDAYSGFGRMRMVVPTLTPDSNQTPVADAGADQTVSDKGKPGAEKVTLTGSGSYDPDGTIVSHQWLEDGAQIATGETATVNLAVGSHTVTLRVTDDQLASSENQVTIQVMNKNGDLPDDGGSGGSPTSMGVYTIEWSAKKNLDARVNIRRDSNGNNRLD
ncbi:MAG: S8 family serine peptidase, partial [Candidatus Neomarinimicrobiota bacterium]